MIRSVVYLIVSKDGDAMFQGTGFVVANSAGADRHASIVTARHVVEKAAKIEVVGSDGRVLGEAQTLGGPVGTTGIDAAVLAMEVLRDAAEYDLIPGLLLASDQRKALLVGTFSVPGGAVGGLSGAPIIDQTGRVAGVFGHVLKDPSVGTVSATAGNGPMHVRNRVPQTRQILLPERNVGFGMSLYDPILASRLGGAGRAVTQGGTRPDDADIWPAQVPGYPGGSCVAYVSTFQAMNTFTALGTRFSIDGSRAVTTKQAGPSR